MKLNIIVSFLWMLGSVLSQENTCGGYLGEGVKGEINYKINETYENNERCLWTVLAGRKTTVQIQLVFEGFQVCALCDFITIYSVNNQGQIVNEGGLFRADGIKYNFTGPLLYISFTSNGKTPGSGFSLRYEGVGEDESLIRSYQLHHLDEFGQMRYPDTGLNFPSNEFVSFVIQPNINQTLSLTMGPVDNGFSGIYCDRNLITLYECDHGRVASRLRYCRSEDATGLTIRSPQPFILTFFSSVAQTGTGFSFSWSSD